MSCICLSVDGLTFALNPEFNSLGHLSSLSYPSGSLISYAPNSLGQAKQAGSYAYNATYHPNGLVKFFSYGNGISFGQTLDSEQRPDVVNAAGSYLTLDYTYDANNNVSGVSSNDSQFNLSGFVYDGLDRLKNVNGLWGAGSFTYDTLSNIKTQSLGSTSYTYTYSATTNRLSSISGNVSKTFGSDGRGNLTQNGTQTLTFNAANEMVNGNGATYLYDAYHRLVKKTQGSTTTYSVYDHSGTLITQYKPSTNEYTDFIKLGKQTVAEVKGGTATYQHTDVLGSPIAESTQGQSITRYHYKPFGERMETFAQDDTGYTGHQFDTALGLTYAQRRYYDQTHPRFMSIDPVEFTPSNVQSFNRYLYANNNPYKYNDPDGEFANFVIGAVIGMAVDASIQVAANMASGQGFGEAVSNINGTSLMVSGALGAVGQFGGSRALTTAVKGLSNSTKGAIGEKVARAGIALRGEKVIAAGEKAGNVAELGNLTGRAANAVPDFVVETAGGAVKVVEAKFGTSGLTGAQTALKNTLGEAFTVSRTTYGEVSAVGGAVGAAAGGAVGNCAGDGSGPCN